MILLKSFAFSGLICLICQVVLDNTKLTPGHITSILTVIGSFLSFCGIYDILITNFGTGATTLISNFGHMLYSSGISGYYSDGFLGILENMLTSSGVAIISVIVSSFVFSIIFKSKD